MYYTSGTGTPLRSYGSLANLRTASSTLPRSPSALLSNGRFRLPSASLNKLASPRSRTSVEDEAKARAERMRRREGSVMLGGEIEVVEKKAEAKLKLSEFGEDGKFVGATPAVVAPVRRPSMIVPDNSDD